MTMHRKINYRYLLQLPSSLNHFETSAHLNELIIITDAGVSGPPYAATVVLKQLNQTILTYHIYEPI